MEFQFCHKCGTKVPSTAKFCSGCGTPVLKLDAVSAPEPPVTAVEEAVPVLAETIVTTEPEAPVAPENAVFTLDSLDTPAAEAPQASTVFTLESLLETESEQPEPEPVPTEPEPPQPESAPIAETPVKPQVVTPPAAPAKPRPTKGILARRGVGRTILAVLMCILIFAWSFLSVSVLNVRLATTGDQAAKTFDAAFSSIDLTELPASMIFTNLDDPDLTLTEWFIDKIDKNYTGSLKADPDDLQEFLEESSVIPFISEQLGDFLSDIYNDTSKASITAGDIEDLLTDNADLMDDIFGKPLSRKEIKQIAQQMEDSGVLEQLSTEALKDHYAQVYRIIQIATSWWVIGVLGVLLLLLVLLLQLINRSVLRTCRDTGITLMVVSGIWGLGGLFVMLLPKVWASMLEAIHPVDAVIGSLLQNSLIPTAAAFGTGVVLVLIHVIGKLIVVKSAQKQTL